MVIVTINHQEEKKAGLMITKMIKWLYYWV